MLACRGTIVARSDAVTVTTCCCSNSEAPAWAHMTSIVWYCVGTEQPLIDRAWQDKCTTHTIVLHCLHRNTTGCVLLPAGRTQH